MPTPSSRAPIRRSRSCWCSAPTPAWCTSARKRSSTPRSTDVNDPFALVRLEGDALASEPSRLVEEAHTIPLFGGKRAVWVKAGGRNFAAAVEAVLATPAGRLPHRHRGRRSSPHRAGALALREIEIRRRHRLLRRHRARSGPPGRRRDEAGQARHRARRARRARVADRRRPPGLAQRDPQARALRPRQGPRHARRRARGRRRRLGAGARRAWSTRPSPATPPSPKRNSARRSPPAPAPARSCPATLRYVIAAAQGAASRSTRGSSTTRCAASFRRCISAAEHGRGRAEAGPRRGSAARWSSSPRPRSTCAARPALSEALAQRALLNVAMAARRK